MSTPINACVTGTFTSDGLAKNLSIPSGFTKVELVNLTDWGSAAANTNVMKAFGYSDLPAGYGEYQAKTSGAATIAIPTMVASNGFTFVSDSALLNNGASVALNGTEINRAAPAVASTGTTTGLIAGSTVVRLFGTTGMLQVSSMDFTIGTIVGSTSFQLKYLDNSGFAADATAGTYRVINADSRFYPKSRYITGITAASSAVITMSVTHGFTAGQAVRFVIPDEFGMTQLDGLIGNITAVTSGTTNTITVDIDSSAFTAFAFPTSAQAAAGVSFAQVVPVGETANATYANSLGDATVNQAFSGVVVGTSVQTSVSEYQWIAQKGLSV